MAKLARSVSGEKSARSAISKVCRRERRRSAQNLVGRPDWVRGSGRDGQDQQPLLRGQTPLSTVRAGTGAVRVTSVPAHLQCTSTQRNKHTPESCHVVPRHTWSQSLTHRFPVKVRDPQPHPESQPCESCSATCHTLIPRTSSHLATLLTLTASESHTLTHSRSLTHAVTLMHTNTTTGPQALTSDRQVTEQDHLAPEFETCS